MTIRKIELKEGVSSAKMQEFLDALKDMRRRPQWAFFTGPLSILLWGTPEEVKAVIDGDLDAVEKAVATMAVMVAREAA